MIYRSWLNIRLTDRVKERIEYYPQRGLEPGQISGYLAEQEKIHISHETIYQHIGANNGL